MTTVTANNAKQNGGKIIDEALQHPVSITRHGRPSVVIVSHTQYEAFIKIQGQRLEEEVRKGFSQIDRGEFSDLSADQIAERVLQRHLNNSKGAHA